MPLSSLFKQTEDLLDEVLRTIQEEHENPHSVLCETDRKMFVEDEEEYDEIYHMIAKHNPDAESIRSLRQQLKETETESTNSMWRNLVGLPSPQAAKCLKNAEELRQRVKVS